MNQWPWALTSSWIDWFLGLNRVGVDQDQTLLGWQYVLPSWVWAIIVVSAVTLAGWSYIGLVGRSWPKVFLSMIRALLLVFLAAILAGPMWVQKREAVEPDWLLMLVDCSASMEIQDAGMLADGEFHRVSRREALVDLVNRHTDLFSSEQLGRDRHLVWLGFAAQTFPIEPESLGAQKFSVTDDSHTTLLRTAIEQALQHASGHPISGVVLFTDGRSPQSTGSDLVHELVQQAVSVFPVPFGAAVESVDLSLARVESPRRAFVNDPVTVNVWIDRHPLDARVDPDRLHVRLIDSQTGQVIDDRSIGERGFSGPLRLIGRSAIAGQTTWRVALEYDKTPLDGTSGADGVVTRELIAENNHRQIKLEFVDRPIRVLYVEGYPRWEYRYLKNALVREKSVLSSIMLLSADQEFSLEGDVPVTRLPHSRDEFQRFDVIIIGDVPADHFSLQQQSLIRDQVAKSGAGLIWIGGADHTPYSYEATQLADLLPMRRPGKTIPASLADSMMVTATVQARSLGVLALREPSGSGEHEDVAGEGWPQDLPALRWIQDIGMLKSSVDVLANVSAGQTGLSIPLVVRHRYGTGQILYIASDDTWRWRYGRGDLYYQQFWIQLVRMLGRHRIQEDIQRVRLSLSHQRVELDNAVVVTLDVRDPMLIDQRLPTVSVSVSATEGDSSNVLERLELTQQRESASDSLVSDKEDGRIYKAIWKPRYVGKVELKIIDPALQDMDTTLPVEVLHPDDELRQPMPDHARLKVLADLSGGKMIMPSHFEELATLIPNRARRTPNDIHYPLWDAPISLVIVLVLLSSEWVGRKLIQLA